MVPQLLEEEYDEQWAVGSQGITINDIVLVGVLHTSAGTWQPILRLARPLAQQAHAHASGPVRYPAQSGHLMLEPAVAQSSSPEQFTMGSPHQFPNSHSSTPPSQVPYADGSLTSSQPYGSLQYM
jgi:hypothetical protein